MKWSSRGRIHNAINGGNDYIVRTLLAMGSDIEEVDSEGRTPLALAIYEGHEHICELLAGAGADIEKVDSEGRTPLALAAYDGNEAICRLLLEAGASIDTLGGIGIIHKAVHEKRIELVRQLLKAGVDSEEVDSEGRTPLVYAHHTRQWGICNLLVEAGASIDMLRGIGIMRKAVEERNIRLVRQLLKVGVDIEEIDSEGRTPLALAVYKGYDDICKLLVEAGASIDMSRGIGIMHKAVQVWGVKSVQQLLKVGVDIEEDDSEGRTPLALAAYKGYEHICKLLLGAGADFEKVDFQGRTPLALAAYEGCEAVCELLLEAGASIEEDRGHWGTTPLLHSVRYGQTAIAELLIEKGADVCARNDNHETAIHCALQVADAKSLICILENGARGLVDERDRSGLTALHKIAAESSLPFAKALVEGGASLRLNDGRGWTPYQIAMNSSPHEAKEVAEYLWSQLSPDERKSEIPPSRTLV
ncbi:ankyrin repeat-containing domain protein [Tricharina praecox]|uniref:ankyrin repeat-containing domain protein n=1 Tax=Tricharina praecox TaxID=43433 RepID=UPI002220BB07|nr:ankyrin repeat-containing domain protein [Tricharina praecox]KAI5848411.1 ankyrin repeat-containing domain protein [Tricharina praecox]